MNSPAEEGRAGAVRGPDRGGPGATGSGVVGPGVAGPGAAGPEGADSSGPGLALVAAASVAGVSAAACFDPAGGSGVPRLSLLGWGLALAAGAVVAHRGVLARRGGTGAFAARGGSGVLARRGGTGVLARGGGSARPDVSTQVGASAHRGAPARPGTLRPRGGDLRPVVAAALLVLGTALLCAGGGGAAAAAVVALCVCGTGVGFVGVAAVAGVSGAAGVSGVGGAASVSRYAALVVVTLAAGALTAAWWLPQAQGAAGTFACAAGLLHLARAAPARTPAR